MAITVTATQGGTTGASLILRVFVLTGAKTVSGQTGNSTNNQFSATATWTQSITTTAGSNVYGAAAHGTPGSTDTGSNATITDSISDGTNNWQYVTFKALNVTGAATVRGFTISASNTGPFAQLEILAQTTLAEDGSAPGVASGAGTANLSVTTGSFTPPGGSLLVAIVASNGGGGVTSMTVSGGSLSWSEKVKNNPSGGDYAGVWIADVPAAAGGGGIQPAHPGRTWLRRFHHPTILTAPPPVTGTPLAGIPDSPALALASAVGANTIAGLAGLPVPALQVEGSPGQAGLFGVIGAVAAPAGELEITPSLSGGTSLVGTPAPALALETAITAAGLLGLTATPAPALELETSRPAAGLLGLTATPAPAIELETSLPATGTLAVITALTGTPPPALVLDITPSLSGGGALVGTPAPALELSKAQPAAGLLGLAGIPPPAFTLEAQRPATGIYALIGTPAPAAPPELGIPASGGSTVTGTASAAIQLLSVIPANATLAVPPPIVYGRARVHTGQLTDSEPGTGTPAAAYAHTGNGASAATDAADPATARAHTGKPADSTIRGDT